MSPVAILAVPELTYNLTYTSPLLPITLVLVTLVPSTAPPAAIDIESISPNANRRGQPFNRTIPETAPSKD